MHQRPLVVPAAGSSGGIGNENGGGHDNGDDDEKNAARLAPLHAAWNGGGGGVGARDVCAQKYASDANRRNSLQAVSASSATAQEQR